MKSVFKVRVVTKNMVTDTFAKWKSIIGGRVKAYEKIIADKVLFGEWFYGHKSFFRFWRSFFK